MQRKKLQIAKKKVVLVGVCGQMFVIFRENSHVGLKINTNVNRKVLQRLDINVFVFFNSLLS